MEKGGKGEKLNVLHKAKFLPAEVIQNKHRPPCEVMNHIK